MIYEYTCKECKFLYEVTRKLADKDLPVECPKCSSPNAKRKYSVTPKHFSWGSWNPLD